MKKQNNLCVIMDKHDLPKTYQNQLQHVSTENASRIFDTNKWLLPVHFNTKDKLKLCTTTT